MSNTADFNKTNIPPYPPRKNGKTILGIIVILIGITILLKNVLPYMPDFIFSWPMFLLVLGLIIGSRNGFKGNAWWIVSGLGIIFFLDQFILSMVFLKPFILPGIIIILGILIIVRNRNRQNNQLLMQSRSEDQSTEKDAETTVEANNNLLNIQLDDPATEQLATNQNKTESEHQSKNTSSQQHSSQHRSFNEMEDFISMNTFFGGNTRKVYSKDFKGANITCLFGGVELDLTNADFNGLIFIDFLNAFGGCEVYLPSDWRVINESVSILGGIEDRRRYISDTNANKTVVIKGTILFGGLEIKNA